MLSPGQIWEIIKFIVDIIFKGGSKASAFSQAATKFNMDESEIKNIYLKYSKFKKWF